MAATVINPFISLHVPMLWTRLLAEFGLPVNYWPDADETQAAAIKVLWVDGTEAEEVAPGRYSHATVQNSSLPSAPALGDALEKDGVIYDVVRVNAYAYNFAALVLQERA